MTETEEKLLKEIHLTKKENFDYNTNISKQLISIKDDTHHSREYSGKNIFIIAIICLLAGTVFGMNVEVWKPVAKDAYEAVKFINKATK